MTAMLAAALDLADAGWLVHPCRELDQGDYKGKAPYLPHGFKQASSDHGTIRSWWHQWPDALIGACVPDTVLVLDIDPRNGGSVQGVTDALGPLPQTLTAWSGRGDGGSHLYFLRPNGPLSSHLLPTGVDLKVSGYVIMPPSLHPATGQPYRWEHRPIAQLPRDAVAALRRPVRVFQARAAVSTVGRTRQADALVRAVQAAPDGSRNGTLFWAARRSLEEGHGENFLRELDSAALSTGLHAAESARTLQSARDAHRAGAR